MPYNWPIYLLSFVIIQYSPCPSDIYYVIEAVYLQSYNHHNNNLKYGTTKR